jgi:hypothetical protein
VSLSTRIGTGAAVIVAAAVVGSLVLLPPQPFTAAAPSWTPSANDVRGVFHVHTRRSDGTGTVEDVAAAAARTGLQFVIITDHGDGTRQPDPPAYHSGVLCIDAVEISTTAGHYAALGLGRAPFPLAGEPRDVADDVRRLGGFGIVTHPLSEKRDLAWHGWDARFDAIEWLNGDSLWREAPGPRLAQSAWTYPFRPVGSLARLYQRPAELAKWDALARSRRIIAIAGTDAHARLGFRDGPEPYVNPVYLKAPSYDVAFAVASLHLRLERPLRREPTRDAEAILSAIRAGHLYTTVDGLGRGGRLEFNASSGGATAHEGDRLVPTDPAVVRVRSNQPANGWIVLFRDGMQVHRVQGHELIYASDREGTYRAEVWVPAMGREGFVPWAVTNAIVVGPGEVAPSVVPPDMNGPTFWLEVGDRIWGVEHDPRSGAALERGSGLGLRYTLAAPGASAPYAALIAAGVVDPRATGIGFLGRADRPMRVSVQLRVPTAGDGLRWQRSVYLDQTPREVLIPFAEMRAVGQSPDPGLHTKDVRALLFVVDAVNTKPASTGRFVVDEVRFFSPDHQPGKN